MSTELTENMVILPASCMLYHWIIALELKREQDAPSQFGANVFSVSDRIEVMTRNGSVRGIYLGKQQYLGGNYHVVGLYPTRPAYVGQTEGGLAFLDATYLANWKLSGAETPRMSETWQLQF